MTLQHIVLFSFPRELSEDEAEEMRAMVASWPGEIGLMTKCRFGTDLTGARTRGYNYLLYTEFPDVATMNEYRAHPVHLRFLDWLVERDCTPLAFDYLPRRPHRLDDGGAPALMTGNTSPRGSNTSAPPYAEPQPGTGGDAGHPE